ncbi:GNAT family N-acetyltransferase [Caldimonas brevitalea]|uniref:GCN5-related N-acetyltransferase n=1 Tax=Caldimonas brevitalea TaxID=413882 RepID=A0A0G3BH80_9BURK|nr:GNAT family N-acetyltransferase [Caldimonas brevitalea]AKJ26746.1 GCN5-related N-acetyltransferase [Caldimonas brevitalea]
MTAPLQAAPIRPYRSGDLASLYEICLRTGWHGEDATAHHADPRLLGDVYAAPYAALEPALVFVAEDASGVVGYVLGTADSVRYAQACERHWWPALRRRHALPDPDDERGDAALVRVIHQGLPTDLPFLADHPAHLHIDLLPRGQGQGLGRALMTRFMQALRERGVPGVHLGVSAHNPRAIAFYERYGFSTLETHPWGRWMGLRLAG